MLLKLKVLLTKLYLNFILLADHSQTISERSEYLLRSVITLTPFVILLKVVNLWFTDNVLFGTGIILLIMINMFLGGAMHNRKKDFKWSLLIKKTVTMVVVTFTTYLVLEMIISILGKNMIVEGFRAALQVATLLYPGSKILKNIFILSKGEHPPKWIMQKVYNFKDNGDLAAFLSNDKPTFDFILNNEDESDINSTT